MFFYGSSFNFIFWWVKWVALPMTETIVFKQVSQPKHFPLLRSSEVSPPQTHAIGREPTDWSFLLANARFALKFYIDSFHSFTTHIFNVFKKQVVLWVHLKSTGRSKLNSRSITHGLLPVGSTNVE